MYENKYLDSKKASWFLFVYLFLLYAVVYMTKSMFSSAMATIVEDGFMTKSQTGLINAVFWFVYALFQFVGGFAVDKYSPHILVMIGLGGSAVVNLIIFFNQSYPVIMAAWAFNAVIQFGVWPGIFKIVSTQLFPSIRGRAVFWLLLSTSVGLGISMLVASFVSHWQLNFLISAISLLVFLLAYFIIFHIVDRKMVSKHDPHLANIKKEEVTDHPFLPLIFSSGLFVFLIMALLRVAIDNGVKMMTPVMLMESYPQLPAALSTRLGSVLIIFSVLGTLVAGVIQSHITNNEAKALILLFSLSLLPLGVSCLIGQINYWYILISLSLTVMLVHGASPFGQSYVALRFDKFGRIGTVSGILNAVASIGNVMASYLFAKIAEVLPWDTVTLIWLLISLSCVVLSVTVMRRWTKFIKR